MALGQGYVASTEFFYLSGVCVLIGEEIHEPD